MHLIDLGLPLHVCDLALQEVHLVLVLLAKPVHVPVSASEPRIGVRLARTV
jgi:hypothetical protein